MKLYSISILSRNDLDLIGPVVPDHHLGYLKENESGEIHRKAGL
jgi:hypothetical protein